MMPISAQRKKGMQPDEPKGVVPCRTLVLRLSLAPGDTVVSAMG